MPDVVGPAVRSRMMSGIRGKNTRPELLLRSGLHRRGLRFRIHDKRLPGKPDIVFPGPRAVVFVHGCFWHGHEGCRYFKVPDTRRDFWLEKILGNRARDEIVLAALEAAGWRVAVVWECATRAQPDHTIDRVEMWIRSDECELEVSE